jgi:hypothetical protein
LEVDSSSCVVFWYYNVIVSPRLPHLSMKISKEVAAAIVGGPFILGAALIGSWDKIFPPPLPIPPIPEVKGPWRITEKGRSTKDGLEIVWDYNSKIIDSTTIRMRGKKIKVNGKAATSGEKLAQSVYNLTIKGNKAEGDFEESNSQGTVLRGKVKLDFTENFRLVSGYLENDGGEGSTLLGERQ